jgi:release factor glutamine methyltransferase
MIRALDEEAGPETEKKFLEAAERLRAHEPLQYVLGEAPFYGRTFRVDSRVLIPRFDTEILIEEALRKIDERLAQGTEKLRALDLCTGSGCIAVTLLEERPCITADASDLSPDALDLARSNEAFVTGHEGRIRWIHIDLFEKITERYDLIVTNPPYVSEPVIATLDPEVHEHEPQLARSGGRDGLDVIRRIAGEAGAHLREQGVLLMEIGDEQGPDVLRIFEEKGYKDLKILKDLAGRDRVLSARI